MVVASSPRPVLANGVAALAGRLLGWRASGWVARTGVGGDSRALFALNMYTGLLFKPAAIVCGGNPH